MRCASMPSRMAAMMPSGRGRRKLEFAVRLAAAGAASGRALPRRRARPLVSWRSHAASAIRRRRAVRQRCIVLGDRLGKLVDQRESSSISLASGRAADSAPLQHGLDLAVHGTEPAVELGLLARQIDRAGQCPRPDGQLRRGRSWARRWRCRSRARPERQPPASAEMVRLRPKRRNSTARTRRR